MALMDDSNPYRSPDAPLSRPGDPPIQWLTALGGVAVACALLGLFARLGYGTFAMRGIRAAMLRDPVTARRMAMYADTFSLAQLLLGVLAVALGWSVNARSEKPALARGLGRVALGLGIVVLLLLLMLV
jgi:hypothetical protein